MRASWIQLLSVSVLAVALGVGCAAPEDASAPAAGNEGAAEQDLTQATDAAIQGKLKGILKDVTFTSEGDYPYVVFEGETVTEKRLSTKLVRQKLAAGVKANSDERRDIAPAACRSSRLNVSETIAEGSGIAAPVNRDDDMYAFHDRQLSIALKVMRSQLRGVVGYTFGTNASGDQDEFGTVHYVYVGISKTTGKLIAIMTQAVYT